MRPPARRAHAPSGFTLLEIVIVVAILGLLAALAIPAYGRVVEKARIAQAIGDIKAIGQNALAYELENGRLPSGLDELGMGSVVDPWGNDYVYVVLSDKGKGAAGARKDRFLVPINSYFDLYSKGPDESSALALTAKSSQDDIIWANDGGFVGSGAQY
ncbi:MAG: prepilin-type N-terminal cleavage/methylation domain-containing protein [Gemmatimonadetes bacterium]|nr:prepilin-type N-terminal cleavage/methylation domain-containing protein [Gemmatimonadota bacterium]NNF38138.1 prepilin-type N-terminal cleavage/methylation domain-containing protein [Gemmatimonadota bacterium]